MHRTAECNWVKFILLFMRMYTKTQDCTVMCSTRPTDLTWVRRFARTWNRPGHGVFGHLTGQTVLLACNQPFLCMCVNISTMFLAGGHIHEPMLLPICFSIRLLHHENGLPPVEKTLTNDIYLFMWTLHGNATAHASFHLNTSSAMRMIAADHETKRWWSVKDDSLLFGPHSNPCFQL